MTGIEQLDLLDDEPLARAGARRRRRAQPESRRAAVALRRFSSAASSSLVGAGGLLRPAGVGAVSCGIGLGPRPLRDSIRFRRRPLRRGDGPGRRHPFRTISVAARGWTSDQWAARCVSRSSPTPPRTRGRRPPASHRQLHRRTRTRSSSSHSSGSIRGGAIRSVFEPAKLPGGEDDGQREVLTAVVGVPARDLLPSTVVTAYFRPARSFRKTSCGCTSISRRRWA